MIKRRIVRTKDVPDRYELQSFKGKIYALDPLGEKPILVWNRVKFVPLPPNFRYKNEP